MISLQSSISNPINLYLIWRNDEKHFPGAHLCFILEKKNKVNLLLLKHTEAYSDPREMDSFESTVPCDYTKRSIFAEQYYMLGNTLQYWPILLFI